MENDYIKREDALNAFNGAFYPVIAMQIRDIPAADVEPVRHGKWEQVDEQPHFRKHFHRVYCSVCRHEGYKRYPYCPYCHAKMDGEEQE